MVDGRWQYGHPPSTIGHNEVPKLHFEVNGQTYFLNFDPSEGRWFVYEPTRDGMLAVAVHSDDAPLVIPNAIQVGLPDAEKVN